MRAQFIDISHELLGTYTTDQNTKVVNFGTPIVVCGKKFSVFVPQSYGSSINIRSAYPIIILDNDDTKSTPVMFTTWSGRVMDIIQKYINNEYDKINFEHIDFDVIDVKASEKINISFDICGPIMNKARTVPAKKMLYIFKTIYMYHRQELCIQPYIDESFKVNKVDELRLTRYEGTWYKTEIFGDLYFAIERITSGTDSGSDIYDYLMKTDDINGWHKYIVDEKRSQIRFVKEFTNYISLLVVNVCPYMNHTDTACIIKYTKLQWWKESKDEGVRA